MAQKTTKKKPKEKTNKYQKPLSLHGVDEKEVLKELLKSPPMPKPKKKNK